MIMIIKDLLLYGTIEKIMIFFLLVLKYCITYVHTLKNHTLNLKMKSRKLAAYFALRVVHTSQPAFRHKNTAKLAPFPRQKYEY